MLKAMENLLDAYNLRARLFPAFLALVPVGLGVAAWVPVDYQLLGTLGGLGATLGFATLLQQIARDAGRRKEEGLFARWGGRPSVRMLDHAHSDINRQTLTRYHAKLRSMAPELKIPESLEEESARSADVLFAYESCNDILISKTRDKEKFALLAEENMNYGFRRNLWGLKPYGLVLAALGVAVAAARLIRDWLHGAEPTTAAVGCAAVSGFMFVVWVFVIKPDWVRTAATSYARRLIASCDQLGPPEKDT